MDRNELGQFNKGVSGNPSGRPHKGTTMKDVISAKIDEIDMETGKTHRELMVERFIELAKKGDKKAFEILTDRLEGKPKETVDMNIGEQNVIIEDLEDENDNPETEEIITPKSTTDLQEPEKV